RSCGACWEVAQVRRASAAIPCRTVSGARSMNAVFNLPERPNPCKAALRSSVAPRRITCETRTSLRQRSAFLHVTVDQPHRHRTSEGFAPTMTHLEPLTKVSREGIKVAIQSVTGKERDAERRPGSVAACG